ncbi:MAG: caspase family protein, partial [Phaeodactylibacter sp.]|nr:caspase family protein [Phaeodactylibacter sp.]
KPSGKGIMYFANGNKYIGHWELSFREGEGKLIFKEGHEYFGQFMQNQFNGHGIMSYANGDRYEGNWANDRPNGDGIYFFAGGSKRFEGNFLNGRFHGFGIMYYADGTQEEGRWDNGQKDGEQELMAGTATESETATSQTTSSQEEYNEYDRNCNQVYCGSGLGTFTYSDGTVYRGEFNNGQPEGESQVNYSNGDRYVGGWKEHAPHGKGVMHYKSGRVLGAVWNLGRPVAELPAKDQEVLVGNVPVDNNQEIKIWAVVVGVSRYEQMPILSYPDDDAYQLYAFLKSPEGGALPEEQIKVLVDEDATRYNILRIMRQTLLQADANDVIFFYFSGHGLQGAFLPSDYDGYNNRLTHEEVRDIMLESKAKHKLVLADACHSGSIQAIKKPVQDALDKYYRAFEQSQGGIALFMSSKGEEYSLEDGGLRSGVFSYFLIQGLKGAADSNLDGIISIIELYDYVYGKVRMYTAGAQTPILTGNFDNRMPVGVRR